ncbi:hypothetical protein Tco_0334240, partial [Tanacetum coccineum]
MVILLQDIIIIIITTGPSFTKEVSGNVGACSEGESHGSEDESQGSKDKGPGSEDEGPGSEEEEEATPEGQQQAVSAENTAIDEPLGLGYEALRHRELVVGEGEMPSTFE